MNLTRVYSQEKKKKKSIKKTQALKNIIFHPKRHYLIMY